jgi:hypothetical protein
MFSASLGYFVYFFLWWKSVIIQFTTKIARKMEKRIRVMFLGRKPIQSKIKQKNIPAKLTTKNVNSVLLISVILKILLLIAIL